MVLKLPKWPPVVSALSLTEYKVREAACLPTLISSAPAQVKSSFLCTFPMKCVSDANTSMYFDLPSALLFDPAYARFSR
jgi:hypothetical protein